MIKLLTRILSIKYKATIRKQQQAITDIAYQMGRVQEEKKEALNDANKYRTWWQELKDGNGISNGYVYAWKYRELETANAELNKRIKELTKSLEDTANESLKISQSLLEAYARIDILERVNKDMDIRLKTKLCRTAK